MITKDIFLTKFNGHGSAYSSFMVIDVKLDDLIRTLNEINPDMIVGSGCVGKRSISFEICNELPDMLQEITAKLNCRGYADIGAWYGEGYFVAYENGKDFNDFTAKWLNGEIERNDDSDHPNISDEEAIWDCFVTVTDNESGETFETGDGYIGYEETEKWKDLVNGRYSI